MAKFDSITEDTRENYRQLKAQTGRSWEAIAEQFDRDAEPLAAEHAAPYRLLAEWARAEGEAEDFDRELAEAAERQAAEEKAAAERQAAEEKAAAERQAAEDAAAKAAAEEAARQAAAEKEEPVTEQREGTTPGQDPAPDKEPKKRTATPAKPARTA